MNALDLARRRAALRQSEEGAVMFIVAMTLAVLASVGVYALAAAATEVRTSGNERQNTQTHYLAQYGVLGAAHELTPGVTYSTVMRMWHASNQDTNCVSLQGVPVGAPATALECVRMGSKELSTLGAPWLVQPPITTYAVPQAYTPGIAPGSFGTLPMFGDFYVELTEAMQLSTPVGNSTNSGACSVQITATSVGFTQPGTNLLASTSALLGAEGVETQRARVVPLSVPCPH